MVSLICETEACALLLAEARTSGDKLLPIYVGEDSGRGLMVGVGIFGFPGGGAGLFPAADLGVA